MSRKGPMTELKPRTGQVNTQQNKKVAQPIQHLARHSNPLQGRRASRGQRNRRAEAPSTIPSQRGAAWHRIEYKGVIGKRLEEHMLKETSCTCRQYLVWAGDVKCDGEECYCLGYKYKEVDAPRLLHSRHLQTTRISAMRP